MTRQLLPWAFNEVNTVYRWPLIFLFHFLLFAQAIDISKSLKELRFQRMHLVQMIHTQICVWCSYPVYWQSKTYLAIVHLLLSALLFPFYAIINNYNIDEPTTEKWINLSLYLICG